MSKEVTLSLKDYAYTEEEKSNFLKTNKKTIRNALIAVPIALVVGVISSLIDTSGLGGIGRDLINLAIPLVALAVIVGVTFSCWHSAVHVKRSKDNSLLLDYDLEKLELDLDEAFFGKRMLIAELVDSDDPFEKPTFPLKKVFKDKSTREEFRLLTNLDDQLFARLHEYTLFVDYDAQTLRCVRTKKFEDELTQTAQLNLSKINATAVSETINGEDPTTSN